MEQQIYSVTQVNTLHTIHDGLDRLLAGLCVRGELSNYKVYPPAIIIFFEGCHRGAALRHV